jgi:hypothetical protein
MSDKFFAVYLVVRQRYPTHTVYEVCNFKTKQVMARFNREIIAEVSALQHTGTEAHQHHTRENTKYTSDDYILEEGTIVLP